VPGRVPEDVTMTERPEVSELRLVVTAADYDEALRFYRDVLGLPERAAFSSPGGRVTILEAGPATLELADPPHAALIDAVAGGRRGGRESPGGVGRTGQRGRGAAGRGRGRDGAGRAHPHAVELAERPAGRARRPAAHPVQRSGGRLAGAGQRQVPAHHDPGRR